MDLSQGTRLGPYEIVARLGAGGMGEVYRARDTRLDRSVAIKVLPSELAKESQLKLRFEREAKAISQLNHPNICTLYDVGDGYLVMELLEGETLAQRIAKGPMPVADILRYGAQIADALYRAHRAGIVHRDLKPANVMLTRSGAKLLDFGLAKPVSIRVSSDDTTMQAAPLTEEGTIVGTFHYMAPEQLEGVETDARTDIFALGAVLYEMATGRRAFEGSSKTSIIAAIVTGQPPSITSLRPLVPSSVEHLVQKCLEKDPEDRWQSSLDVASEMRWLASSSSVTREPAVESVTRAHRLRRRLSLAAAFVATAIVAAIGGHYAFRRPQSVPRVRYISSSGADFAPAGSPDGKSIAFSSARDGRRRIWVKQLSGGGEIAITDGPDTTPRFSPDGATLLFVRGTPPESALYRVPVVGGAAQRIVAPAVEGDWSPDGHTLTFTRYVSENGRNRYNVFVADASGTNERMLFSSTERSVQTPRFSPDGKTIAASLTPGNANVAGAIVLIDVASGKNRIIEITDTPTAVVWLTSDEFLYGRLQAVTGVQIAGGEFVRHEVRSGHEETLFSLPVFGFYVDRVGDDSLIVETPSRRENLREVALKGTPGSAWRTQGNSNDRQPALSADGEWIIFSSDRTGNLDVWALSRKSGEMRQLTDDPKQDWDPQFTPDGKHILFSSNRTGHFEIWKANTDGSYPQQVSNDGYDAENPTQGPGGEIYFASVNPKKLGLWQIKPDGSSRVLTPGNTQQPEVSPDGAYIAYRLSTPDRVMVMRVSDQKVVPFAADFGSSILISVGRARWRPDGKAIIFVGASKDGKYGLYEQEFDFGRDTAATRRPLTGFDGASQLESHGITPDGSALIVAQIDDLDTLTMVRELPFPKRK